MKMKQRTNANGTQMKCKRNSNANAETVNEIGEMLNRNDRIDKMKCKRNENANAKTKTVKRLVETIETIKMVNDNRKKDRSDISRHSWPCERFDITLNIYLHIQNT